jgi:hypothetical protein
MAKKKPFLPKAPEVSRRRRKRFTKQYDPHADVASTWQSIVHDHYKNENDIDLGTTYTGLILRVEPEWTKDSFAPDMPHGRWLKKIRFSKALARIKVFIPELQGQVLPHPECLPVPGDTSDAAMRTNKIIDMYPVFTAKWPHLPKPIAGQTVEVKFDSKTEFDSGVWTGIIDEEPPKTTFECEDIEPPCPYKTQATAPEGDSPARTAFMAGEQQHLHGDAASLPVVPDGDWMAQRSATETLLAELFQSEEEPLVNPDTDVQTSASEVSQVLDDDAAEAAQLPGELEDAGIDVIDASLDSDDTFTDLEDEVASIEGMLSEEVSQLTVLEQQAFIYIVQSAIPSMREKTDEINTIISEMSQDVADMKEQIAQSGFRNIPAAEQGLSKSTDQAGQIQALLELASGIRAEVDNEIEGFGLGENNDFYMDTLSTLDQFDLAMETAETASGFCVGYWEAALAQARHKAINLETMLQHIGRFNFINVKKQFGMMNIRKVAPPAGGPLGAKSEPPWNSLPRKTKLRMTGHAQKGYAVGGNDMWYHFDRAEKPAPDDQGIIKWDASQAGNLHDIPEGGAWVAAAFLAKVRPVDSTASDYPDATPVATTAENQVPKGTGQAEQKCEECEEAKKSLKQYLEYSENLPEGWIYPEGGCEEPPGYENTGAKPGTGRGKPVIGMLKGPDGKPFFTFDRVAKIAGPGQPFGPAHEGKRHQGPDKRAGTVLTKECGHWVAKTQLRSSKGTKKYGTWSYTGAALDPPGRIPDMRKFVREVLEPIKKHFDTDMVINCFLRTPRHNKSVRSSPGSQHEMGQAADIWIVPKSIATADDGFESTHGGRKNGTKEKAIKGMVEVFKWIAESGLPFGQLLMESTGPSYNPTWIHISSAYGTRGMRNSARASKNGPDGKPLQTGQIMLKSDDFKGKSLSQIGGMSWAGSEYNITHPANLWPGKLKAGGKAHAGSVYVTLGWADTFQADETMSPPWAERFMTHQGRFSTNAAALLKADEDAAALRAAEEAAAAAAAEEERRENIGWSGRFTEEKAAGEGFFGAAWDATFN